jgi:hypothetical protein
MRQMVTTIPELPIVHKIHKDSRIGAPCPSLHGVHAQSQRKGIGLCAQFVEKHLRLFQVGGVEALGEAAIDIEPPWSFACAMVLWARGRRTGMAKLGHTEGADPACVASGGERHAG